MSRCLCLWLRGSKGQNRSSADMSKDGCWSETHDQRNWGYQFRYMNRYHGDGKVTGKVLPFSLLFALLSSSYFRWVIAVIKSSATHPLLHHQKHSKKETKKKTVSPRKAEYPNGILMKFANQTCFFHCVLMDEITTFGFFPPLGILNECYTSIWLSLCRSIFTLVYTYIYIYIFIYSSIYSLKHQKNTPYW